MVEDDAVEEIEAPTGLLDRHMRSQLNGRTMAKRELSTMGLGDIMSSPSKRQHAASPAPSLAAFAPLHRVCLTANGNLQRIVSAYHDAPVTVVKRYSRRVEGAAQAAFAETQYAQFRAWYADWAK